ncbi:MAG: YcfL family protein [Campylobacterota bacterium]|nr:YcfL family protein [Campylobacterota bacterium]
MKKLLILTLFISCLTLQADNTSSNTLDSYTDEVVINNIPLSYNIEILGSNSRFVADLLDARVSIRNKDRHQHNLEYKFIWYDVGGFEMAKQYSKWKKVAIDSKDTIVLKSLAITPKIDSFKVYIRGISN